jgi:hypothetical protein
MKLRSGLFGAALLLGIFPLAGTYHVFRDWLATRASLTEDQQLRSMNMPWTRQNFMAFIDPLREAIPEDAKILCTPNNGDDIQGKSRWFLFLADALYPRRIYVREPQFASGTLVTYPLWVEHHVEVIDTDGSGLSMKGLVKSTRQEKIVADFLEDNGIEWESIT